MCLDLCRCILIGLAGLGLLVGLSESSRSPWKLNVAEGKLLNGTVVTETQFQENAFASASIGVALGKLNFCFGTLVSTQYFVYSGAPFCVPSYLGVPIVNLGSSYPYYSSNFDGETYNITAVTQLPGSLIQTAKLAEPLTPTSKAKPVPPPKSSLLHTPPPVGSKCNAFGYSLQPSLNRLAVTIVAIPDCKSQWAAVNSSIGIGIPDDGSVFCAYVTNSGTAQGLGSICGGDLPSLVICEDWSPRTPTCGWHSSRRGGGGGGGGRMTWDKERALPTYFLAG